MQAFELPSHLFRWCLTNTSSGNAVYSYEICFGQYLKIADGDSYLWRSYDRRLKPLIREISVRDKPRVLEVGSGFGHDLVWAACRGAHATGVEVNSEFVEISNRTKVAIERHTGQQVIVDIRRCNLLNMPDGQQFDVIFMKDVFHHLEPREEVVAKLGHLLSSGGTIIIVEPNAFNPLIQLQMFRIRGFRTVVEKTDATTGDTYLFGNERPF